MQSVQTAPFGSQVAKLLISTNCRVGLEPRSLQRRGRGRACRRCARCRSSAHTGRGPGRETKGGGQFPPGPGGDFRPFGAFFSSRRSGIGFPTPARMEFPSPKKYIKNRRSSSIALSQVGRGFLVRRLDPCNLPEEFKDQIEDRRFYGRLGVSTRFVYRLRDGVGIGIIKSDFFAGKGRF